ncbi:MAG: hypothetical protein IPJ95_01450 [Gemmatimonadetes bacterium]|nr:hypothetical protein [Gemmatimonadota bacterium]
MAPRLRIVPLVLLLLGPACGGGGDSTGPSGGTPVELRILTEPSPSTRNRADFPRQPSVQLFDASGRAASVAGIEVTASVVAATAQLAGPTTVGTDAGGRVQFTGLSLQGRGSAVRLVFAAPGVRPDTSAAILINAGNPALLVSMVGDTLGEVPAGGIASANFFFRLTDADGNGVGDFPVTCRVLTGGGTVSSPQATTQAASGNVTCGQWLAGGLVGLQGAEARTAAAPFIAETVLVRVRTGPPAGVAVVNGDQQAVPVATAVPVPPTVQVRDQFGNPVSGVPILFSPASAAAGSVSGGSQVTDALGRATVGGWTVGTQAGTVSLAVSLQPSGAILGYVPATALPGPPDAIAPVPPATDTLVAPTSYALSGLAFEVLDAYGNRAPGVPVSFTPAAGAVDSAVTTTDLSGRATPGLWHLGPAAGVQTLTASAGTASVVLPVRAHGGRLLLRVAGDSQAVEVGTAPPVTPMVRVTDSAGTPVAGVPVRFVAGPGTGTYTGPAEVRTDALGEASAPGWTVGTVRLAGSELVPRALGLAGDSVPFVALLQPGPPTGWAILHAPVVGPVNATPGVLPAVRVTDRFGNGVPAQPVTWTVRTGGGRLTQADSLSDTLGTAVAVWVLGTVAGANELVARTPLFPVDSLRFLTQGLPGPPDSLTVARGAGQVGAVRRALPTQPLFTVLDAYANPIPGVLLEFSVVVGGGTIEQSFAGTDLNGRASPGQWTLGPVRGLQRIRAVVYDVPTLSIDLDATGVQPPPAALTATGGSFQTVRVGAPSPMPLAARLTDSLGFGIGGDTVQYTITSGGGSLTSSIAITDTGGVARLTGWILGSGTNTLTAVHPALPGFPAQFTATGVPDTSGYQVTLNAVTPLSGTVQAAFDAGTARWQALIVGDIPDETVTLAANSCFTGQPAFSGTVDDLLLFAWVAPIDGAGGILGGTGICAQRTGTSLPSVAAIILDQADLQVFGSLVPDIVLHEIGHAVGIGAIWQARGLLVGAGSPAPRYTGTFGRLGYWAIAGAVGTPIVPVPVEGSISPPGSRDSHWEETTFDKELMTPYIDGGTDPLSLLTAASLIDLGYVVDLAAANGAFALLRQGPPSGRVLHPGWELVFPGPIPPGVTHVPPPPR